MTRDHKTLLVTGCARSGTRYTSLVLRRVGLDVPHERMGRDGITSWLATVDAEEVAWGDSRAGTTFEHVYHQVRHPLDTIASSATLKPSSWHFIADHVDCDLDAPPVLRGAQYWLRWNERAEGIASWRYRIEDLPSVFDEFYERLGVQADRGVLSRIPNDVNTRRRGRAVHYYDELCERLRLDSSRRIRGLVARRPPPEARPPTWEQLAALDAALTRRLREKAREYGYHP